MPEDYLIDSKLIAARRLVTNRRVFAALAEIHEIGFDSRRLHSTHLALAFGNPKASLMASHLTWRMP